MSFETPDLPYRLQAYSDLLQLQPCFDDVLAEQLTSFGLQPGSPAAINTLGKTAYYLSLEAPVIELSLPTIGADAVKPGWIQYGRSTEGLLQDGIIHIEFTAFCNGAPHTQESDRDISDGGNYCALFGSESSEVLPLFYPAHPNGEHELDLTFSEIPRKMPMTDEEAKSIIDLANQMLELPLDDPSWHISY